MRHIKPKITPFALTFIIAACVLMIGAHYAQADVALPSQAEQRQALAIAVAYWDGAPTWNGCGPVGQTFSSSLPLAWEATVDYTNCNIVYADWAMTYGDGPSWETFCTTTIHEYGHLVLGPTYFAASNPTDPAHSPDPNNIMYSGGIIPPAQCQTPTIPTPATVTTTTTATPTPTTTVIPSIPPTVTPKVRPICRIKGNMRICREGNGRLILHWASRPSRQSW